MKLKITFPEERVNSPILSEVILKTGVLVSIVSSVVDMNGGEMIIEVIDQSYESIKKELCAKGVRVVPVHDLIKRDEKECVECGGCISVCPAKVFSFDKDWNLKSDVDKCIRCKLCISMCPHQALSIEGKEVV
ncbi:Ion-translocating oxidoreductase complex subunit B [Methanosarcinaceae archaeon Ag5]|uniref:Ion-translocating oxidoreductase complex subunit B n=1 Tax=Methanolapillus africanus TaxID=3028297 RepID=A0AAE4SD51_9EURY|nr:Ion-translocating oxidoreductase complex subunit B [Methanosarcinaceae archaeon Ag5]